MPLGPDAIKPSKEVLDAVFKKIDDEIADSENMRFERRGTPDSPYWMFIGSGGLTPEEKYVIEQAYLKAGWGDAKASNSSEEGERGGMWSVKLFKHRQLTPNDR